MDDDLMERLLKRAKPSRVPAGGFLDKDGRSHTTQFREVPGEPLCAEAAEEIARLKAALRPFAAEGKKWLGTFEAFDDLSLLCGEDYGLMDRSCRNAEFTIGDLKCAASALAGKDEPK